MRTEKCMLDNSIMLRPYDVPQTDSEHRSSTSIVPSPSIVASGQVRSGKNLTLSASDPTRTLRQRSISVLASSQQSPPSTSVRRRHEYESLSKSEDDNDETDHNDGQIVFPKALRTSPFLLGPHPFSTSDFNPVMRYKIDAQFDVDNRQSPGKSAQLYLHDSTSSPSMMNSLSRSTFTSSMSDIDLEGDDCSGVTPVVMSPPVKRVHAYHKNYAFTLRSRENVIIHLLMEMKMLQTDLAFILFVTFYQFFHSSVTNLAYWQHAQLSAANRVPLKDLAFDFLPPLDGDLWIVSEYILYGILAVAIFCIVSNLVVKWNAPHGRPIYCMQILRRLGMTWCTCQSLRMISFLVTTLPGASRQCRYATPAGLTLMEMLNGPAPVEGNPLGWNPPTDLYDLIFRVDPSNGCGDLMFSSHTIYTMSFVCVVFKYFNFKWLKWMMALGQIVIVPFILAARKHYSVDVFTALYVTPLIFEILWIRFPDRDTSMDLAMHYGIRFYLAQVDADSLEYVVSVWGKEYQVDPELLPIDTQYSHYKCKDRIDCC